MRETLEYLLASYPRSMAVVIAALGSSAVLAVIRRVLA